MPARPLFPVRVHGPRAARVVGAAGLMLAFAPVAAAHASPAGTTTDAPKTSNPDASTASVQRRTTAVAPNYGLAKVRVGVQIKTGAYVPAGTTTAGSTVTITETGPNALTPVVSTCVTDPATEVGTTTYCTSFSGGIQNARRAALRRAATAAGKVAARVKAQLADPGYYTALPGDTVTLTQTTVGGPALVIDPVLQTAPPCVVAVGGSPVCYDPDVVFTDTGLAPLAVRDTGTSVHGAAVTIHVLANDDTHGAPATIASVVQPAHGHVIINPISTATPTQTLTYTPDAGYSGADPFSYVLSTANGTSTGTVDVTVTAAATTPASTLPTPTTTAPPVTSATTPSSTVSTTAPTSSAVLAASSSSSGAALAFTGGPVQWDAEAGFGLIGIGALLTALGIRRRPRGTHAG